MKTSLIWHVSISLYIYIHIYLVSKLMRYTQIGSIVFNLGNSRGKRMKLRIPKLSQTMTHLQEPSQAEHRRSRTRVASPWDRPLGWNFWEVSVAAAIP